MSRFLRRATAALVRLYAAALFRYPKRLRDEFGDDMVELFRAGLEAAAEEHGWRGLAVASWKGLKGWLQPIPPIEAGGGRGPVGATAGPGGTQGKDGGAQGRDGGADWGSLADDGRLAVRSLVREPRFFGLVVSVLAIGIALNVGVFAVLDAYLIESLPFPFADRIVEVRAGGGVVSWDEADEAFERSVSWDLDVFTLVGDGRPELVRGSWVTPDFLDLYGIDPVLGRGFLPEEADRNAAPVALISHRLWTQRFGRDPDILGQTFGAFTSDRPDHAERFTIIGVLPADFWYVNDYTEVLAPIRGERALYAGRLRPDVPLERAEDILTELALGRLEEAPAGFRVELVSVQDRHAAAVRPTLVTLQGATLLVLLLACANAAVLLLIRSARRARELAVRAALGASFGRLARQLLLEGSVIALAAGVVGGILATWALAAAGGALQSTLGRSVPGGLDSLAVDGTAWMAAAGICGAVGLLFGVVPLVALRLGSLGAGLRSLDRGGTDTVGRHRVRGAMVAAQVALSLALLTGAGLMVRSAVYLQTVDPGFAATGVVRGQIGLRQANHPEPADRVDFFSRVAEQVAMLPGTEAVGLASSTLFETRFNTWTVEAAADEGPRRAEAIRWWVDEGYFQALGIALQRGRLFTPSDALGTEPVAVVSASLATDLWGDDDPIGRLVRQPGEEGLGDDATEAEPWHRVIGVVGDVMREVGGVREGDIYRSYRQAGPSYLHVVARRAPGAPDFATALEPILADLDPDAPLFGISDLEAAVLRALGPTRAFASLLTAFAVFALIVTGLGLYGVVAYAVRQHRKDVAIRMALGAGRHAVTRLFLRQGSVVVALGLVIGAGAGYRFGRALGPQLHGVDPGDPSTVMVLGAALAVTAMAAVWLPARSASATDPMAVLREE